MVQWAFRKISMRCFGCKTDHMPATPKEQPDGYLDSDINTIADWDKITRVKDSRVMPVVALPGRVKWTYHCTKCSQSITIPWASRVYRNSCLKCRDDHLPPTPDQQVSAFASGIQKSEYQELAAEFERVAKKLKRPYCYRCQERSEQLCNTLGIFKAREHLSAQDFEWICADCMLLQQF